MFSMRGMSLVDVIVGSALVLMVFLAFFALLRSSLLVSAVAKATAGATAVTNSQMEYVRSLEYTSIGTVGGIPAGPIPQYATTTLNDIDYVTRTFIEYADDPRDGFAGADSNGITTDYKHVRIEVSYTLRAQARSVSLVSNAAPPSIESTTGGGTLRAVIVDAVGLPVSGASVQVVNASTSPTINVTTFSDIAGVVDLPGAPASTQYQIYVLKSGYSSAQTYARDASNQNPTPGYMTIVANQTTTGTFAIDLLSAFTLRTFSPIAPNAFTDGFDDGAGLVDSDNTTTGGSALTLSGTPGAYPASGDARSTTTAPAYLAQWTNADAAITAPVGTDAHFSVATGDGALIPDAALPGNSTGFMGTVDLSSLSTTTYPSLSLVAALSSSNPLLTPSLSDWTIAYEEGPVPLPNVSFTLTGAKTKGSTIAGDPVFKTIIATTTDETGLRSSSLEWDSYDLVIPGYTTESAAPEPPYEVLPGTALDAMLIISN